MSVPTLKLTKEERINLRRAKIKFSEILDYDHDELAVIMKVPESRAKEVYALCEFQQVPSIGLEFAKDLIFLGIYGLSSLRSLSGSALLDIYEQKKGYRTDPCVEDQFRLVVHYAKHGNKKKRWWHFTQERKEYRLKHGYPADRPALKWSEVAV